MSTERTWSFQSVGGRSGTDQPHLSDEEEFVLVLSDRLAEEYLTRVRGLTGAVTRQVPDFDLSTDDGRKALAAAVVTRVVSTFPRTSEADKLVGPFYRASDLAEWKGVTRQAISKQAKERKILHLVTSSGTIVFPAWQFSEKGASLPRLAEVLNLIDPTDRDPLGSALWLNRASARFDGLTPADALRAGRTADVLRTARQIASANAA
jgi:hypothetical protein